MTLATSGAWARANHDLVVARVEDDVLEISAPADAALDVGGVVVGDGPGGIVGGGPIDGPGAAVVEEESDMTSSDSEMSHISCSTTSDGEGGSEGSGNGGEGVGDDSDSIVSETDSPRRIVRIGPLGNSGPTVVPDAIVGDDQSAEADANAEVEVIENRHDDSIPWEDYYAPAPDGGDDSGGSDDGDGGDGDDDDGGDGLNLRPVERAQLRFETNLAGRLQTFAETGTADTMLVQMLTHG